MLDFLARNRLGVAGMEDLVDLVAELAEDSVSTNNLFVISWLVIRVF